ncbi:hypothetical protein CVS40_11841 [Lucilia cuprina]|nr:hypothetical protein CVS40_11841 [Lucilia cuprina]
MRFTPLVNLVPPRCECYVIRISATCENISDDELKAMENFKTLFLIYSSCKKTPPSAVNLMRN